MTPDILTILTPLVLWGIAAGYFINLALLAATARVTPDLEPDEPDTAADAPAVTDADTEALRLPVVTAVVPARNEAESIAACVRSLLAQQGVDLRVIAVDDRSEDGTGALLAAIAREDARLTVLRVDRLPPGWLGKNHANHVALSNIPSNAQPRDPEEVMLFTDGDVSFAPTALHSAVGRMRRHGLGHLAVSPRLITSGFWEQAFLSVFACIFALQFRLWRLQVPGSRAYVGIGAANLVRRADYERIGGHRPLAMEVVDDVKLGLLLRRSGVAQGLAAGHRLISVRWQPGFRASMGGLQKNLFASAGWRWSIVLGGCMALTLPTVLPWAALGWVLLEGQPPGASWWGITFPALLGAGMPMAIIGATSRRLFGEADSRRANGLEGLAAPVVVLAFLGALLVSATLATLRGGIWWRETFYSLAELRAGCVRERDHPPTKAPGWRVRYP